MNSDNEEEEWIYRARNRSTSSIPEIPKQWHSVIEQPGGGLVSSSSSHSNLHSKKKNESSTGCFYSPTRSETDFIFASPIQCFCKLPAQRRYTLEYGAILECASFDYDKDDGTFPSKYICGFHIHERPWSALTKNKRTNKKGQEETVINLQCFSLRTCPRYNFTVCSIFKVENTYRITPPLSLPLCFCKMQVVMFVTEEGQIRFTCKNSRLVGVGRCAWDQASMEVGFPKEQYRLHNLMDYDDYYNEMKKRREQIAITTDNRGSINKMLTN